MRTVAALYVQRGGVYWDLPGVRSRVDATPRRCHGVVWKMRRSACRVGQRNPRGRGWHRGLLLFQTQSPPGGHLLHPLDAWDEQRYARNYRGPWPVVAHPPCQLQFRDLLLELARSAK